MGTSSSTLSPRRNRARIIGRLILCANVGVPSRSSAPGIDDRLMRPFDTCAIDQIRSGGSTQLRGGVGAQAYRVIGGTAPYRAPTARPVWPDDQRAQRNYATVQCR